MLVRKSSDDGKAAVMSNSGCAAGCASTFFILLKAPDFDDTFGKGGISDSADCLLVGVALSFCLFFDRKRFIVGYGEVAICFETVPYRREPIRPTVSVSLRGIVAASATVWETHQLCFRRV